MLILQLQCSLFLFYFDEKRKSRTEKEKHEWLNGTRTPKQICHTEFISASLTDAFG